MKRTDSLKAKEKMDMKYGLLLIASISLIFTIVFAISFIVATSFSEGSVPKKPVLANIKFGESLQ